MKRIADRAVARAFSDCPPAIRRKLLALRTLILATAATTKGVGKLQETLKWGEPAYLTAETGSGSTIRLAWKPSKPGQYAMLFNCQTTLIDTFRARFPTQLRCEGNRAIVFALDDKVPVKALQTCIADALTYHLGKKRPRRVARVRIL